MAVVLREEKQRLRRAGRHPARVGTDLGGVEVCSTGYSYGLQQI